MMDGVGRVGGGEVEEYIILNLALWAEVQVLEVNFFSTHCMILETLLKNMSWFSH